MVAGRQFDRASISFPRDQVSAAILHRISPQAYYETAPDSVLRLNFSGDTSRTFAAPVGDNERYAVVAISEPAYHLIPAFVNLCDQMRRAGTIDRILVVAQVSHEDSDIRVSRDLVAAIGGPASLVSADFGPAELAHLYRGAQFVVGTRLHSMILGLLGGTPSFPVELNAEIHTSHKSRGTFELVGLGNLVLSSGETSDWGRQIAGVLNPPTARSLVTSRVEAAQKQWRNLDAKLLRELDSRVPGSRDERP
jgi:polysaccharide pyruvyl transferase WcaK-like protein